MKTLVNKWNSLPPDVQKVLDEVSEIWIGKHGEAWDSSDEAGKEFTLSLGNKIISLSEKESARWAKAAQPVVAGYIKDKTAKGLPAKAYVDFIKATIKKLSK